MKLLVCDGKDLTVRDAGPVIMHLRTRGVPIKLNGKFLMEDDAAREELKKHLRQCERIV